MTEKQPIELLECPSCSVHPHYDPCTPNCGRARAEKPHEFKFATHCPKCAQPQPEAARLVERCGWCETDYDFHTQTAHCPHDFKVTAEAPVIPEGETPPASCAICGGVRVRIRGRFPREPQREVCPTCLAERIEEIEQLAAMSCGAASHD